MNWYVPLLVTGLFLAFSATVFLVSLAISHKMLAGNADYQKQRRFLLVMWAGFTFFTLVDMGIDRLYGKPVSLVDLMIGFMGSRGDLRLSSLGSAWQLVCWGFNCLAESRCDPWLWRLLRWVWFGGAFSLLAVEAG